MSKGLCTQKLPTRMFEHLWISSYSFVSISLSISLNIVFCCCFFAQKNHLNDTVLLSTHNKWFDWEIRKLVLNYAVIFIYRPAHTKVSDQKETAMVGSVSYLFLICSSMWLRSKQASHEKEKVCSTYRDKRTSQNEHLITLCIVIPYVRISIVFDCKLWIYSNLSV